MSSGGLRKLFTIALVVPVMVLTGCGLNSLLEPTTADRDETGVIIEEGKVDVFSFQVGDCLSDLDRARNDEEVFGGGGVPCQEPHIYEVYAHDDFRITDLSTAAEVAEEFCAEGVDAFLGFALDLTSLNVISLTPTEQSFLEGDRAVTCLLHRFDRALVTDSLRGKGQDYWVEFASFLGLGECLNGLSEEEDPSVPFGVVDCDEPHVWEVYHIGYLPEDIEPPIDENSQDICLGAYEDFVGQVYERSIYDISWFQPESETFELGDRRVACLIHTLDLAPVMGSLEGVER